MSMKSIFNKSTLYRNRHILGFFFVAFMIYIFVAFSFARNPIGLSDLEMQSIALSGNFSFPSSFIDLPYHFLQWISISLFGPTPFGVRLPSVILAMLAGGFMVAGVKNLVRSNVAIITGLIISSSVFFLNYARLGAPMIMSMFLLTLSIFAISKYLTNPKKPTVWLVVTVLSTVLGVYSPMGIFFLATLILIAIFHPKVRLLISRLKIWQTLLAVLITVGLLSPIVLACISQPTLTYQFLGIDAINYQPQEIWHNIQALIMPWSIDSFGLVTPFFNIVEIALVIIGIVTLFRQFFSARSHLFLGLGLIAFIISMFDITNSYIIFVPYVFLVAFGVQTIIDKWYKLFPVNPFARFFGLVPIGVLILVLTMSNFAQYNLSNYYDDSVIYTRDETFQITRNELTKLSAHNVSLVVAPENLDLYNLLLKGYTNVKIGTSVDPKADTQIFIPSTFYQKVQKPSRVVTNGNANDNIVLKIYQKLK